MNNELQLRIVLQDPPAGVDFGLQKGSGNNFETVQKQRSGTGDLTFTMIIQIKGDKQKDPTPGFVGKFVQGPVSEKFIYLDIGTIAGQLDSEWSRRLKVPLRDISWDMVEQVLSDTSLCLETQVPGKAKDGGPNCATVKPFGEWKVK
ncbi:DUF5990 family protein [Mucilaginibacter boryungensis]|uniref:Uncharacterized protein n=1 Tax=Mucilaginibacter boryungensis TaxID=768480 RepID=A0ABR9XJ47_9SPHI|nr:DUF5990 family protein [Mucilaginibacter boryungensis]MBE9667069.1 hypothetical protein [Mucilaginibacter boryungensis]